MHPLIAKMYELVNLRDYEAILYAENCLAELLTFSSFDDLVKLLDEADENYRTVELPVLARILAYRLAYLQNPQDVIFLQRMVLGLRRYGPDWDSEADKLEAEANKLDGGARQNSFSENITLG